ncbi:hypothetical protein CXG81DRAFT_17818 [Caulochytrium protostelioides]|uniref:Uncharacterized protein n=1 Tax=Caulochytrium protostelioides TaxID=1555241 RepID=A0A4P9XB04_9FUNG|nr:hypothetical protein CXG81DRAFT_17818 [Caulochytrium protostelioides]|eukprot:RKP02542.1 hypothetical protein CXG81DRAFT_17818 [Caulochytrium protostelioides]
MVAIQLRRARRALQARQTAGDTDPLKTIRRRLRRRHEVTDAEGHHHHHHHDKDPTPADDAANDASNQEVTQSEETANPHQHSYQHNHQHHHRHEAGTDRQTSARGRHSQHVIHTHENFQDDDDVDAHADADTDANSHQAPAAASEDAPAAESAKETDASQPHDHHGSHQPQKAEASVRQAGLAEPAAVELPPLDWPLDGINAGSKATEANPAFAGAGTGQVTGQATAAPLNAAEHHQKADPMHLGSLPGGVVTLLAILIGGGALLIVVVIVVRRRRRRAVRWSTALPKQSHIHVDPIDYASAYGAAERGEPNRFDPGAPILGGAGFVAPTEGYVHAGTAGRWERGEAAPRPETMLFDHTVPSTQRRHDGHPIMASAVAHDWMPGRGRTRGAREHRVEWMGSGGPAGVGRKPGQPGPAACRAAEAAHAARAGAAVR